MDDAFLPHIAGGQRLARNEFVCTSQAADGGQDLLEPQSAYVHAIALSAPDYAAMAASGTALVWSPRSNIRLYGNTAAATLADRAGVSIALGTNWIPTGSMNLLRELRCADSFNQDHLGGYFSAEDCGKW